MFKKILSLFSYLALLIFLILTIFYFLIDKNIFNLKTRIYLNFPNIELKKFVFKDQSVIENLNNDYNVKFLPETQFENLKFIKKKIKFLKSYYKNSDNEKSISYRRYGTFFIDLYKNDLIISDYQGSIYKIKDISNEAVSNDKEIIPQNLNSDLKSNRVFDALIYEDIIYLSFSTIEAECNLININYASLKKEKLNFKSFFQSKKCNKSASPGRMQVYNHKEKIGLIFTTAEGSHNNPGKNIQNDNSIFGKTLFIPFDGSKYSIFSKGHRVIQGLYSDQKIIIGTEHGPRGGDELNKITEKGNYGWPIASFGEKYSFKYGENKIQYKKKHSENNFTDPIFSFIEGIGISEIIKLPKNFSIYYDDHFVIASLNGRAIYFIRFNNSFNKILTIEKVFVGKRIRDLKYLKKNKILLLALEEEGEIAFITKD